MRCPRCRGTLRAEAGRIACDGCGEDYAFLDGVPVLLDPETSLVSAADLARRSAGTSRADRLRETADELLPRLGRSHGSRGNYELLARSLTNGRVLVVGGRILGVGMEPLLEADAELLETDLAPGPRTMLVCDAQRLPFADGSFDAVVAQAVLYQVPAVDRAVAEIHRVLRSGGLVYAEDPFMQQVTGGAFDFHRWTPQGQRRLFSAFEEVGSGMLDGPATALASAWQYFLLSFARSRAPRYLLRGVGRLTAFWLKYVDDVLFDRPAALDAASAVFFLGRKGDRVVGDREIVRGYRGAVGA